MGQAWVRQQVQDAQELVLDSRSAREPRLVPRAEATKIRQRERAEHRGRLKVECGCGRVVGELLGDRVELRRVVPRGDRGDGRSRGGGTPEMRSTPNPAAAPDPTGDQVDDVIAEQAWRQSRAVFRCGNPRCGRTTPVTFDRMAEAYRRAWTFGGRNVQLGRDA